MHYVPTYSGLMLKLNIPTSYIGIWTSHVKREGRVEIDKLLKINLAIDIRHGKEKMDTITYKIMNDHRNYIHDMNKNKESQSKCWQQRTNLLTYLTKLPKDYSLNFSMVKISCNERPNVQIWSPLMQLYTYVSLKREADQTITKGLKESRHPLRRELK